MKFSLQHMLCRQQSLSVALQGPPVRIKVSYYIGSSYQILKLAPIFTRKKPVSLLSCINSHQFCSPALPACRLSPPLSLYSLSSTQRFHPHLFAVLSTCCQLSSLLMPCAVQKMSHRQYFPFF